MCLLIFFVSLQGLSPRFCTPFHSPFLLGCVLCFILYPSGPPFSYMQCKCLLSNSQEHARANTAYPPTPRPQLLPVDVWRHALHFLSFSEYASLLWRTSRSMTLMLGAVLPANVMLRRWEHVRSLARHLHQADPASPSPLRLQCDQELTLLVRRVRDSGGEEEAVAIKEVHDV